VGLVGLPNVGKTTIFNALTNAKALVGNYPFCTIEPNMGMVNVLDGNLEVLARMYKPIKIVPTTIEFVDIAGLVKGASKGQGLGNQFLSHIRSVDLVVYVLRAFEEPSVVSMEGNANPVSDYETIETELVLSDLDIIERRIEKVKKLSRVGVGEKKEEEKILQVIIDVLSKGSGVKAIDQLSRHIRREVKHFGLLSLKPGLILLNCSEKDIPIVGRDVAMHISKLKDKGLPVLEFCGKLEAELSQLELDESRQWVEDLGLKKSGLERLVSLSYTLLGLITFYTTRNKEIRAWTIEEGTSAREAAGKIHSDFERGFIKAEIIRLEDLVHLGSEQAVKEHGLLRFEGKGYSIKQEDVVTFRFNV